MQEKIKALYDRWQDYKSTAEQHEFVNILMKDSLIERAYRDLQSNWSDEHAEIFIRCLENMFKNN